ncbi:SlyX family protein [Kerstersia similis]|uniref:SlyX family protein n=1 Tax=Kerstersia similis TaxID=206505 RepID=UPI0039EFA1CF
MTIQPPQAHTEMETGTRGEAAGDAQLAQALARVQELEIRSTLADDMLDQLNQQMFRMQRQLEALQRQLTELRDQIPAEGTAFRSLRDELPPHY